jgi:hypothetical protein
VKITTHEDPHYVVLSILLSLSIFLGPNIVLSTLFPNIHTGFEKYGHR